MFTLNDANKYRQDRKTIKKPINWRVNFENSLSELVEKQLKFWMEESLKSDKSDTTPLEHGIVSTIKKNLDVGRQYIILSPTEIYNCDYYAIRMFVYKYFDVESRQLIINNDFVKACYHFNIDLKDETIEAIANEYIDVRFPNWNPIENIINKKALPFIVEYLRQGGFKIKKPNPFLLRKYYIVKIN